MLTETSLRTFEITVSLNQDGSLRFDPGDGDVEAARGDHIVWKSTVGDLVLYIQGVEEKPRWSRKSPFKKFLYADGRDNGQGEAKINPQVKSDAELLGYKYTIILFDEDGESHEEDPRIVIR